MTHDVSTNTFGQQNHGVQTGPNHGTINYHLGGPPDASIDDTSYRNAVQWLSAPDPSTNHFLARELHDENTCQWLLEHELYIQWKTGSIRHLWLHGKPGCGKTVLSSTVIEDLQTKENVTLLYFYFTFTDEHKQSYDDLLLSLAAQIAQKEPARSALRQLHLNHGSSRKAARRELEKILVDAASVMEDVVLVLDALDESPETKGTRLNLLAQLEILLSKSRLRLFATSRPILDIEDTMKTLKTEQISLTSSIIDNDIQIYLTSQLSARPKIRRFKHAIKATIHERVLERADGMFRWVVLLLEQLSMIKITTHNDIEAALDEFPKDLDDVYARILHNLEREREQNIAVRLLTWITYARTPLTLGQLVEALTIRPEDEVVDIDAPCEPEDILGLLTSLVITYNDEPTQPSYVNEHDSGLEHADSLSIQRTTMVRLAHFTVQEYLESARILEGPAQYFYLRSSTAHELLTKGCLIYLLHYSSSEDKKITEDDIENFPLLVYASREWDYHASLQEHVDAPLERKFLENGVATLYWRNISDYGRPDSRSGFTFSTKSDGEYTPSGTICGAIYYASDFNRLEALELLTENGESVNVRDDQSRDTAIEAAAKQGHTKAVALLLTRGADINGDDSGTPLQAASSYGQYEITGLLLNKGANVNVLAGGSFFGHALTAASYTGHIDVVKLLLNRGADINAEGGSHGYALTAASHGGHIDIVKLLLENGADINVEAGDLGYALTAASWVGHIDVVKLLLERGADVNARGGQYGTAIEIAHWRRNYAVVNTLREHGAIEDTIISNNEDRDRPLDS